MTPKFGELWLRNGDYRHSSYLATHINFCHKAAAASDSNAKSFSRGCTRVAFMLETPYAAAAPLVYSLTTAVLLPVVMHMNVQFFICFAYK